MKFSYQWLKDFVPGLEMPARELEQLITVRTAECEGIVRVGELLQGARVARVLEAQPVSGTHLIRAVVDIGAGEPITVACGAPNCRAGLQTVWAPVGLKRVQSIDSNGMLASAHELDLGRDHQGIIEWPEASINLTPDLIIEIDNKSLTHRPDLWGHHGMAREVAAITGEPLRDPVDLSLLPDGAPAIQVQVEDPDLCPRFSAIAFENVQVAPSPWWLQYRLISIGLNPINNIVDITNFVMAELAQPMHAFDRDNLAGDRLIVRAAHEGETLLALNDEQYALQPAFGVVADAESAVSLAGIIGGTASAIHDATTRVVFESANWKASAIRKTSAQLKLRTDASMRFEKAQDPANTVRALARTVALMRQICPGARLAGGLTDVHGALPEPHTIRLRLDVVNRKLGMDVSPANVREILTRLAFVVTDESPGVFRVTVPSWRATKDVSIADDLVEEAGRMIGYENIVPRAPLVACTVPPDNPQRTWHREIRSLLTARGYTEVYNYSFLSDAQAERFQLPAADLVRVLNPIASDQNLLRSSLIPGIFANLESNAKHESSFRLFEIGREIHQQAEGLPREVTRLVAAIYGDSGSLFELKRIAESVAPEAQVEAVETALAYEHPARCGNVKWGDRVIGRLFESHPNMLDGRAAILDLDLDAVLLLRLPRAHYTPIRRYPSSSFDLSFAVPRRKPAAEVAALIRNFAGPLLESAAYLSEYTGEQVPEGLKNITYRLTVSAPDRTLSSGEINAVRAAVISGMHNLGFEMRT